jgi:hypothetical protein
MSFDPRKLPRDVYAAYNQGPLAWPLVVEKAIQAGIRDANKLADIVFYLHHPERNGRLLAAGETGLINQWKSFRNLVEPRLRGRSGTADGISKSTDCGSVNLFNGNLL